MWDLSSQEWSRLAHSDILSEETLSLRFKNTPAHSYPCMHAWQFLMFSFIYYLHAI